MLACKYRICQDKVKGNLEVIGGAGVSWVTPTLLAQPRQQTFRARHVAPLQRSFRGVTLCGVMAEAVG